MQIAGLFGIPSRMLLGRASGLALGNLAGV